ncbi:aminoacyl-tRNA hydrolase [Sinimarinibacterium sp. CAU 1509]|uniref:alternative ribosome rescue aminoacyl-tRNA hydrolase ArfB n=1 Tax=Sinimarinibacterium sp. CAU 1509 TaxID=2562283 RepID=UPI0010AC33E1|nr:alternative ribosome rescue aminoacyl-tRNA hydrolase ArfB [Sinimarinibacterium sp. CAU 1509]TJY64979.1 aminoacyl-tRNA hydrolase [Sinimarinibacterium sp. CAU 1509]
MNDRIDIGAGLSLAADEVELSAIRAQGAGGQNVNKTSNAIHLRFDIPHSSLPVDHQQRLLGMKDRRIGSDGVLVIKAQRFRSLEQNRADALERLVALIQAAGHIPKARKATRPPRSAQRKRVDSKVRHGRLKSLRSSIDD